MVNLSPAVLERLPVCAVSRLSSADAGLVADECRLRGQQSKARKRTSWRLPTKSGVGPGADIAPSVRRTSFPTLAKFRAALCVQEALTSANQSTATANVR